MSVTAILHQQPESQESYLPELPLPHNQNLTKIARSNRFSSFTRSGVKPDTKAADASHRCHASIRTLIGAASGHGEPERGSASQLPAHPDVGTDDLSGFSGPDDRRGQGELALNRFADSASVSEGVPHPFPCLLRKGGQAPGPARHHWSFGRDPEHDALAVMASPGSRPIEFAG